MRPSEVLDEPWVWAERHRDGPAPTERSGKWLIFVSTKHVDEAWEMVRAATEDGALGPLSKVSTAMPSEYATGPDTKVICVYTYDSEDVADVQRVREALRIRCRVTRSSYKTDQDTLDGVYGRGGLEVPGLRRAPAKVVWAPERRRELRIARVRRRSLRGGSGREPSGSSSDAVE